jgi:hypothetical protein
LLKNECPYLKTAEWGRQGLNGSSPEIPSEPIQDSAFIHPFMLDAEHLCFPGSEHVARKSEMIFLNEERV